MEAPFWPDEDCSGLSLDESWRVRIASVQVYSIVRNRQISHYEEVLAFLENTFTLLPSLVPAIKHMKITFGLKTMVIMWMLREGAGPVDVVQKINKYFPRELPQYQMHCRKQVMFRMRKNHLDFRAFTQLLIMDKKKLQDYIQNHVEGQYGDRYAQKTEDRLLEYLQELSKALPNGTFMDKIMRKNSPEERGGKALLDLLTDDSKTMASTLKTLLRCDTRLCDFLHKSRASSCTSSSHHVCLGASTDRTAAETVGQIPAVSDTVLNNAHAVGPAKAVGANTVRSAEAACVGAIKSGTMAVKDIRLKKSGAHVVKVPPHFCSKHHRWVWNILCECPGEMSEERSPQDSERSPLLFSSTPSSSDLTPSNLTVPTENAQSPQASNELQEARDQESMDKLLSEPMNFEKTLHPAQTTIQTLIPGGAVNVVVIPGLTATMVTVGPLKTSAKSNDRSMSRNQDSTSSTVSITTKTKVNYTVTPHMPCTKQKCFQPTKVNEGDGSKTVDLSPQTCFKRVAAAGPSAHATSGFCFSRNTCPTDHSSGFSGGSSSNSSHMQPCVALKRMTSEECLKATTWRVPPEQSEDTEAHSHREASPFDVNSLYTSSSSSSSSEEEDSDPEYKPGLKKPRRWCFGY